MSTTEIEACFKKAVELVRTETRNLPPETLSHSLVETLFVQLVNAKDSKEETK